MKTVASDPDDNFGRAEPVVEREWRTRSEVHPAALEYVTDSMNRACDEIGDHDDAFLAAAAQHLFRQEDSECHWGRKS